MSEVVIDITAQYEKEKRIAKMIAASVTMNDPNMNVFPGVPWTVQGIPAFASMTEQPVSLWHLYVDLAKAVIKACDEAQS